MHSGLDACDVHWLLVWCFCSRVGSFTFAKLVISSAGKSSRLFEAAVRSSGVESLYASVALVALIVLFIFVIRPFAAIFDKDGEEIPSQLSHMNASQTQSAKMTRELQRIVDFMRNLFVVFVNSSDSTVAAAVTRRFVTRSGIRRRVENK